MTAMQSMDERRAIHRLREDVRKLLLEAERGERDDLQDRVLELAEFIWKGHERELVYSVPLRAARRGPREDSERIAEDYRAYLEVEQVATAKAAEELAELVEGAMR